MLLFILTGIPVLLIILYVLSQHYYYNEEKWIDEHANYGDGNNYTLRFEERQQLKKQYRRNPLYFLGDEEELFIAITAVSALIGLIVFIVFLCCNIGSKATGRATYEKQTALEYKLSTAEARDEFGLRNKEIIDEIQQYNIDIVTQQELEHDFWVGVFVPDLVEKYNLHTIEY